MLQQILQALESVGVSLLLALLTFQVLVAVSMIRHFFRQPNFELPLPKDTNMFGELLSRTSTWAFSEAQFHYKKTGVHLHAPKAVLLQVCVSALILIVLFFAAPSSIFLLAAPNLVIFELNLGLASQKVLDEEVFNDHSQIKYWR